MMSLLAGVIGLSKSRANGMMIGCEVVVVSGLRRRKRHGDRVVTEGRKPRHHRHQAIRDRICPGRRQK